ncbi:MAG: AMP-binding protein [Desulfobacterales bacterium]|nr:AMP-binding protein [Desulfobacterales bacterium]MDD3082462.1 AMP-binding protein [Desulfobacterales bacterium]MDD3951192.1 AMP-binding protein [Desulfobacterales bacterium]MDD4463718.1 AMP-binding protein [Desulfobacterales bacterium]
MLKENLVKEIEQSIIRNWSYPAFSDYGKASLTYADVASRIRWFHHVFEDCGIGPGDTIALIGKNSANWAMTYLGVISYGAVIVPILPDFHPDEIAHIIRHSESVFVFAADGIFNTLDAALMPDVQAFFSLEDFTPLFQCNEKLGEVLEKAAISCLESGRSAPSEFSLKSVENRQLSSIVYTSGTTGFSKGVMLSHNSLMANVRFARTYMPLKQGDRIVSFLPLAHAFGCAFDFLFPFIIGCHITFLKKIPSPSVVVKAFQEIQPRLVLTVPLVVEKIYKNHIKDKLDNAKVRFLLKLPVVNGFILKKFNDRLSRVFGNNFHEVVIGGASLEEDVDRFLKKIGFRYTIGYGLTECGPLVSYAPSSGHRIGAVGRLVDTLELKIDSQDPALEPGEILVRGENVMDGYYKNREATAEAIDAQGWLHTGDLGLLDADGFIHIKGRSKNMILGPSGQNIYPEEIESRLNGMDYVEESLVLESGDKLVALVRPDYERFRTHGVDESKLTEIMEKNRKELNSRLPAYSGISRIQIHSEEFEKTPTKKIKRRLYRAV